MAILLHQYSSRFLQGLYRQLFDELHETGEFSTDVSFTLLVLALLLADVGDVDPLVEVRTIVQDSPKLYLALAFLSQMISERLSQFSEGIPKSQLKSLRKHTKRMQKWLREHPKAVKALTDGLKFEVDDAKE